MRSSPAACRSRSPPRMGDDLTVEEAVAESLDDYTLATRLAYMATRPRGRSAFSKAQRDAYVFEAARRLMPGDDPWHAAAAAFPSTFYPADHR